MLRCPHTFDHVVYQLFLLRSTLHKRKHKFKQMCGPRSLSIKDKLDGYHAKFIMTSAMLKANLRENFQS